MKYLLILFFSIFLSSDEGDIVVRKTFSKKSYMPWHRDTYFYKKKAVGRTPPLIKLIYYPSFDSEKRIQLKIKRGSHLFFLKNKFILFLTIG